MVSFNIRAAIVLIAIFLTGLAPAVLPGMGGVAIAEEDACPAFPKIPWWGNLTHESVEQLVERRYGGDWPGYILNWERNLTKLISIRAKRSRAAVRSEVDKEKQMVLGGRELDQYIDSVSARLVVMRCLAKQAEAKARNADPRPEAPVETLRDKSAEAGKQLAQKLGCHSCHGEGGISTHPRYPNLAGQSELYLIRQLKEFPSAAPKKGEPLGTGRRHNKTMTPRAKTLSEDDIWNLVAHFGGLDACPEDEGQTPIQPQPNNAARCVECHGIDGKGIFPEVPILAGQKKNYLLEQLRAFRQAGLDKAAGRTPSTRYHYFMSQMAKNMSDQNLSRLADYFSKAGCGG